MRSADHELGSPPDIEALEDTRKQSFCVVQKATTEPGLKINLFRCFVVHRPGGLTAQYLAYRRVLARNGHDALERLYRLTAQSPSRKFRQVCASRVREVIPDQPIGVELLPPPTRFRGNVDSMQQQNAQSGLIIDFATGLPLTPGEYMDYGMGVEALLSFD